MFGFRRKPAPQEATAEQKERGYYGNRRTEMVPFLPVSTRFLLDVGCGRGAFGATVKRLRGATVWGVELDPRAARAAAVRLDRVLQADMHQAFSSLPAGHFDCITFNDVLEHLVDPTSALQAAKRLVAPGGVVVASLPNIRYFPVARDFVCHGRWDYADAGVLDRTHLRFFTKTSMRALFEECGYEVQQVVGINAQFSPLGGLAGRLLPARFEDTRFMQFAIVARPRS